MLTNILISTAKIISFISRATNRGAGSTWPGHIALNLNPKIIENLLQNSQTKVILIVGTNGKTTTSRILSTILKEDHKKIIQNSSGANLLNGLASSLLLHTNSRGHLIADYAVFEVDEYNLPLVLQHLTPHMIIALDLFRDQLDRYGELDSIAKKWNISMQKLTNATTLILNADDPLIAYLAKDMKANVRYFGLDDDVKGQKQLEHAADSIYCPQCGSKLEYKKVFYSHLGIWHCPHCNISRPAPHLTKSYYPLPGTYNVYNTLAAVLAAQQLDISPATIDVALKKVTPAFGRQEKLEVKGKQVQLFLAKNPTSFNESLRTITELGAKTIFLILNDRIPDGRDVSWIWDVDFESYMNKFKSVFISGDRVYDMGLRVAYSNNDQFLISNFKPNPNVQMFENLHDGITAALKSVKENETLYILPTYSAMLEVRKILTGRKIL